MTRMMIATALATTLATAGFAATDTQIKQVQGFNSSIDTSGFSDTDYDIAYGIVNSGMSTSEKTAKLRALATDDNVDMGPAMISQEEMLTLKRYAPDADFSTVTQAQAETALSVVYGGTSESDTRIRVQNILNGEQMDAETQAMVTAGQAAMLRTYVPNADLSQLSKEDLALAMSFVHSGMSRSDKIGNIESLFN